MGVAICRHLIWEARSMKVNSYVGVTVSFVNLCAIITGLYNGGFNGYLEMDGFKDTFTELYQDTSEGNASSLQQNQTRGCGSGSGAASDSLIGIIVASANLGSFFGSLAAGWLSDHFSRKYGLAISGVVMLLGTGLLSASFFVWMLIVARLLSGIAIGIFYMVMPVYIAEMSPKESRGMLGSTIGPTFNVGVTIAFVANIGFTRFATGWRISTVITAILAVIFAVGMNFMPHTPRWLMMKGRDQEALQVLSRINHCPKSEDTFIAELEELRTAIKPSSKNNTRFILKELYRYKYRLLFGSVLFAFNPASGSFIYYYSTTIFCGVGIPAFYAALIFGLILLMASVVLTFFIDKLGRKPLSLLCTLLITVVGLIVAVLIQLFDTSEAAVGYTIVVLLCIYAFGFSCSWLTLPFVITSEIFPVAIRGVTMAIATGTFWLLIAAVNQVIPIITGSPLKLHGYFYIVTGCNTIALFVVLFALPETKGISLEEMDSVFSQSILQRFMGTFKCSFGAKSHSSVECDLSEKDSSKAREDEKMKHQQGVKEMDEYTELGT